MKRPSRATIHRVGDDAALKYTRIRTILAPTFCHDLRTYRLSKLGCEGIAIKPRVWQPIRYPHMIGQIIILIKVTDYQIADLIISN